MVRVNVAFQEPVIAELRSTIPARRRSAFISQAVREKLERLRQLEAIRAAAGAWSDDRRRDPSAEVRELREAWTRDLRDTGGAG